MFLNSHTYILYIIFINPLDARQKTVEETKTLIISSERLEAICSPPRLFAVHLGIRLSIHYIIIIHFTSCSIFILL